MPSTPNLRQDQDQTQSQAKGGYDTKTALSVVIANMIGTGVFTSLGYQLLDIQSGFVILALWFIGGITALCGALCYAELGAAMPRSGGEYNFLSRTYHPAAGFVSGWVSATVGFAAPVALVAITFGVYLQQAIPSLPASVSACAIIFAMTLVHSFSRRTSSSVQSSFTGIKILLIILFCIGAWAFAPNPQPINFLPISGDSTLLTSSAFAVALIYVNYAYTGWNSATYITGELTNPQRSLPRIILVGTATVMLLYIALHAAFLYLAPIAEMQGQIEIAYIAGIHLFGELGAKIMAVVLSILLISSVSAMTLAGPRVLQVLGQDIPGLRLLATTNAAGLPNLAIYTQSCLALLMVLTASFEAILVFTGFILGLNTLFAVAGVFVLRWRQPDLPRPFRVPLYPLPPLIFMGITLWTLVHLLQQRPLEGWLALGIVAVGLAVYYLIRPRP